MTARCLVVALTVVVAIGCTRTFIIFESENGRCEIHGAATADEVIATCGIPDGLRWQAKTGRLFSLEMCSAPAYVYGPAVITFGCDGHPVGLLSSDHGRLLEQSLEFVLTEASSGRHAVAALGELRHRTYSPAERDRVRMVAETASRSNEPTIRGAAMKTLAALDSTKLSAGGDHK